MRHWNLIQVEERASLTDEKMTTFNTVGKEKEKLHNVLVKFKKNEEWKDIKMQLIIFSRHDRQFTLNIMNP